MASRGALRVLVLLGACCAGSGVLAAPVVSADAPNHHPPASTSGVPLVRGWDTHRTRDTLNTVFRFESATPLFLGESVLMVSAQVPEMTLYRLSDGRVEARWEMESGVMASPEAVGEDSFVVADLEGRLSKRSIAGEIAWTVELGSGVVASLRVTADRIYALTLKQELHCISLEDGSSLWIHRHEDRRSPSAPPPILGGARPLVWEGGVFVGFSDGTWANLDPEDGSSLWTTRVAEGEFPDVEADPLWVASEQFLLLSSYSGATVALKPGTGEEIWRLDQGLLGAPVEQGGLIFGTTPNGTVIAVDGVTGEQRWSFELDKGPAGGVLVQGDVVFVTDRHGPLIALDRFTGAVRWTWRPGYVISGIWHPPVSNGVWMVVQTNQGRIEALHRPWLPQDHSNSPARRQGKSIGH